MRAVGEVNGAGLAPLVHVALVAVSVEEADAGELHLARPPPVGRPRRHRRLRALVLDTERPRLLAGDVTEVAPHDLAGRPRRHHAPRVEPHRLVAQPLDAPEIVGDEDDRFPPRLELLDLPHALVLERLVADGEHFVDEEDVGIHGDGDGEAEPHVHARRVGLHRAVDEDLETGEGHDLVEALPDLGPGEPEEDPVDVDVLPARELGMEAGPQLDEGGDAPGDGHRAQGGLEDAADDLEEGRLAGAVRADDPDHAPAWKHEAHVAERPHLLAREQAPGPAAHEEVLDRPDLAVAVEAEPLGHPLEPDGRVTGSAPTHGPS